MIASPDNSLDATMSTSNNNSDTSCYVNNVIFNNYGEHIKISVQPYINNTVVFEITSKNIHYSPRLYEGSNLIFLYKLMVQTMVAFRTSKSLRIFLMGCITVYLAHAVAPRCLVYCISTLPGNGQFYHPVPLQ